MPETLQELLTARTRDEVLASLLSRLQGRGFPVTDWHPGSVARTLVELIAEGQADLEQLTPVIAAGGYLDLASGAWLDLLALSQYQLQRKPATFTRGTIRLTDVDGLGPYTIEAGQLWFSTADGHRFTNTTGGTLPLSGTLDVEARAETPGSAFNVAAGTITILNTPLAGVEVTNPADWLLEAGVDEEADTALRERCRLRWAEAGTGSTADAYRFWALTAAPAVTQVNVFDRSEDATLDAGQVKVVIYGPGGVGAEEVQAVEEFIAVRRPLTISVIVTGATPVEVVVEATVTVRAAARAAAEAEVVTAFTTLQGELPIGGTVYLARLVATLMAPDGVENVTLASPVVDVVLAPDEAAQFTLTLTWVEV